MQNADVLYADADAEVDAEGYVPQKEGGMGRSRTRSAEGDSTERAVLRLRFGPESRSRFGTDSHPS